MMNSARKMLGRPSSQLFLLLLLLTSAPRALAQQPAPKTSAPTNQSPAGETHGRVTETLIDSSIPDDQAVDKMLAVYGPKVRELDVVLGKLTGASSRKAASAQARWVTLLLMACARRPA